MNTKISQDMGNGKGHLSPHTPKKVPSENTFCALASAAHTLKTLSERQAEHAGRAASHLWPQDPGFLKVLLQNIPYCVHKQWKHPGTPTLLDQIPPVVKGRGGAGSR